MGGLQAPGIWRHDDSFRVLCLKPAQTHFQYFRPIFIFLFCSALLPRPSQILRLFSESGSEMAGLRTNLGEAQQLLRRPFLIC